MQTDTPCVRIFRCFFLLLERKSVWKRGEEEWKVSLGTRDADWNEDAPRYPLFVLILIDIKFRQFNQRRVSHNVDQQENKIPTKIFHIRSPKDFRLRVSVRNEIILITINLNFFLAQRKAQKNTRKRNAWNNTKTTFAKHAALHKFPFAKIWKKETTNEHFLADFIFVLLFW